MRQGRNSPAIATLNGKIFAMGGAGAGGWVVALGHQAFRLLNSVEVYDVKTNQWTLGKPLVRHHLSFALYIEV